MTSNVNESKKQALDFQKSIFTSWYSVVSSLQDQAASAVDAMLNQTSWISDEGRQVMSGWVSTCKNERDRYKVHMEESFSVLEKSLAQETAAAPARSDKPAEEAKKAAPEIKSKAAAAEEKEAPAAQEAKQFNQ